MYNINRQNIRHAQMKSKVYIASKLPYETTDEYGNEVVEYDKPKEYFFNIQPINSNSDVQSFGERAKNTKVAVITQKDYYLGKFKEFDLAYLDGVTPDGEIKNGYNANYKIYAIQPQNAILKVYFEKIIK